MSMNTFGKLRGLIYRGRTEGRLKWQNKIKLRISLLGMFSLVLFINKLCVIWPKYIENILTEYLNVYNIINMYVEYIGQKHNKSLTKNKVYFVSQIIENYYYLIKDDDNIESIYEPHLFKIFPLLKVKYIGSDNISLIKNKIYDVISIESGFSKNDSYRIVDETDEDFLFHKNCFEIVENNIEEIL